jgi:hypothetical protein
MGVDVINVEESINPFFNGKNTINNNKNIIQLIYIYTFSVSMPKKISISVITGRIIKNIPIKNNNLKRVLFIIGLAIEDI